MRALLALVLLWVGLALPALAQMEAQAAFITQLESLAQRGDIAGMAALTQAQSALAAQSFQLLVQMLPTVEPEDRQMVGLILNVIARTFDVRLGKPELVQLLAQNRIAAPESAWEGSPLARPVTAATPAQGSVSPENVLFELLVLGNWADSTKVIDGLAAELSPPEARRWARYRAACALGLGRPNEALQRCEKLLLQKADPQEQLATELLAAQAAFKAARPAKLEEHLKKLQSLAAGASGLYPALARFFAESYAFNLELTRHPDMPATEILARHDRAWGELTQFQNATATDLAAFAYELAWIGDMFFSAWADTLALALAEDLRNEKLDPKLKELGPKLGGDVGLMTKLAIKNYEVLRHNGMYFSVVDYLLRSASSGISGSEIQRADADTVIGQLTRILGRMLAQSDMAQQSFSEKWPKLMVRRGKISSLQVEFHLLRAAKIMVSARNQPSDEQAGAFLAELAQAEKFLPEANLDSFRAYQLSALDFYMSVQPPGWQQKYEACLKQLADRPGALETRNARWMYHYQVGQLRLLQSQRAQAIAELQKAVGLVEEYIREAGGGSQTAQNIRATVKNLYEDLTRAQIQDGKAPQAFETVGRLQQLESAGNFEMKDLQNRLKPADRPLVTRAQEARREIRSQEQEVEALKATGAEPARIDQASQLLANSRKAYFEVVTNLEKTYPEFEKLDVRPINFAKLQRSIPKDTLVVLMFPTGEDLFLMEATSDNLLVRKVAVKHSQVNALVSDFRQQILTDAKTSGRPEAVSPQMRTTLGQLHALLISPLEADLKGKQTLAIIPYGSLMYLPFAALAPAGEGKPAYLIEKMQIVVLCKATDLDQIYGPPSPKKGALVAFGNPDGSLPGAGQEATSLSALFPGARVYLEGQATRDKLQGVQAPAVSYLHLATHGVLDSRDPRSSYLKMAKGQKLSVTDITGSRLDGQGADLNLVTLSACQTALGERDPDGSDLRSLADAFSFAGCRSMVASLWSVSDESTGALMVEFYKALKAGKSKAQALQEAQVALLKQEKYARPFYWAPFVLIGDWR